MSPEEIARTAWQAQPAAAPLPPIETLRARSDQFRKTIARRNRWEYIAGAFVIAAFSITAIIVPLTGMRIGAALVVAGAMYVMWQLHRKGSNLAEEELAGQVPILVHQRAALVRQRDAIRSVLSWYIGPFLPGIVLFFAAPILADPPAVGSAAFYTVVRSGVIVIGILAAVFWLNRRGARALQEQIDEIDAMIAH